MARITLVENYIGCVGYFTLAGQIVESVGVEAVVKLGVASSELGLAVLRGKQLLVGGAEQQSGKQEPAQEPKKLSHL